MHARVHPADPCRLLSRQSMAVIQQVDGGKDVPLNVEEATASLATMVVVSILDDAGRRHRERREHKRRAPEPRAPASPLHLPCISPASHLHLTCISRASRLYLGCRTW